MTRVRGEVGSVAGGWRNSLYRACFGLALLLLVSSLGMGFVRAARLFGLPPLELDATILGRDLVERGEYARAVEEFRLAGLIDPERYDPPPELALPRPTSADADALVARQRRRVRERPDASGAHLALGRALLLRGDAAESARSLERARELDPRLRGLQGALGRAYLEAGRTREAEGAFREGVELEPLRPGLHDGLGIALYRLGRLEEAARAFERAQGLRDGAPARGEGSGP